MTLDIVFEEQEQRLDCDFGEVHEIADAEGYGKGYNEGKRDGYAEGYGEGESAGHAAGFEDGKQAGYDEGYQAGGATLDAMINGSITEARSNVETVRTYAFHNTALTSADFPLATIIGNYAFQYCQSLSSVHFPSVTSLGGYSFNQCTSLTSADFPLATSLGSRAFQYCSKLSALILRSETRCSLSSTATFTSTPIASGTGYIYVPAALVESYKTATNWATYANQIRAIEDYPDICGEVTA